MMILLSKNVYLPYEFRDLTVGEGLKYKLYYTTIQSDLENSDVRDFMSNRALPNHKPTILVVRRKSCLHCK